MSEHRNTETQRHRPAFGRQGHRDTETQGHRDTETQTCLRQAGTQGHRDTTSPTSGGGYNVKFLEYVYDYYNLRSTGKKLTQSIFGYVASQLHFT